MTVGNIILLLAGALVALGVGQRVLDRMRLTDRQAMLIVAAMLLGGLVPDIRISENFSLNLGGALLPLALCVWLLIKADTAREVWRALVASALTGVAVYWMGRLLPADPERMWIDPTYLYGLAAGFLAWLLGRSRRGAFVAGILGMAGSDIVSALLLRARGISQHLSLGGAGIADAIVIAGFTGVLLAELMGEITERITRGTARDGRVFEHGEIREGRVKG